MVCGDIGHTQAGIRIVPKTQCSTTGLAISQNKQIASPYLGLHVPTIEHAKSRLGTTALGKLFTNIKRADLSCLE